MTTLRVLRRAKGGAARSLCQPKLLLLTGLLLVAGCSTKPGEAPEVVRPVKTTVVAAGEDVRTRTFPGRVEASRRVELAFQVSGLLTELPVKEGEEIARGDLIAKLRPDEFEARLATLQGELDQARAGLQALRSGERIEEQVRREIQSRAAEARLANARAEHERQSRLLQANAASRSQAERAETDYRIAQEDHQAALMLVTQGTVGREEYIQAQEAVVRALEARVVEANLHLQDSTLRAPYDGVIAQRFVEEGQNIRATEPVVRFQDVDEIEIIADVPEAVMARDIRRADVVQLTAEVSGAPGVHFPVQIREIGQVADATTQTFSVRVAMQAPEEVRVLPGMTATITAVYQRASVLGNRILVPATALYQLPTGQQVTWVIDADSKVISRPVVVGEVLGGQVEITSGLQPGDRIATAGVTFLREGMRVRDLGDSLGGGSL